MAIIKGTPKRNTLIGTSLADQIYGFGDNDTLSGLGGNDTIRGGAGDDLIRGGGGNDKLFGDGGDDKIFGGAGNDKIFGGNLFGVLDGGAGNDIMSVGPLGWALFRGGGGKDIMIGGDLSFYEDQFIGGAGADFINGGGGARDTAIYSDSVTGVTVDLSGTIANAGDTALGDVLVNIEILIGSGARDVLAGNFASNTIAGNAGNDIMGGLDGDDLLVGGSGDDVLVGGAGSDVLVGDGSNTLLGPFGVDLGALNFFVIPVSGGVATSAGRDIFRLSQIAHSPQGSGNRDVILDFEQGLDKVDLSAIPNIRNYFFDGLQPALPNPFVPDPNTGFSATLSFYREFGSTIIQGLSASGPGGGQVFEIELRNGPTTLTLADFII